MIIYTSNIICAVFMHQVYSFHERKHGYSSVSANKISSSFPRNQYQSFVTCYGWIRLFTRAAKTGETAWSDTILLKSLFFFLFFSILKISILSHYTFPCRISRYRRCWSSIKRKPVVWESQRINEDCWTCWEFVWWWWFWIQFDFNLRGRFLSGTGKIQISVRLLDILLSKAMKLRD